MSDVSLCYINVSPLPDNSVIFTPEQFISSSNTPSKVLEKLFTVQKNISYLYQNTSVSSEGTTPQIMDFVFISFRNISVFAKPRIWTFLTFLTLLRKIRIPNSTILIKWIRRYTLDWRFFMVLSSSSFVSYAAVAVLLQSLSVKTLINSFLRISETGKVQRRPHKLTRLKTPGPIFITSWKTNNKTVTSTKKSTSANTVSNTYSQFSFLFPVFILSLYMLSVLVKTFTTFVMVSTCTYKKFYRCSHIITWLRHLLKNLDPDNNLHFITFYHKNYTTLSYLCIYIN